MSSHLVAAVCATAMLSLTACHPDPSVDGVWFGAVEGYYSTLSLVLREADGEVTGTGHIGSPVANLRLAVRGTHLHPTLTLTLSADGFIDAQFTGVFETDDVIAGELTESAFFGDAVRLERDPRR